MSVKDALILIIKLHCTGNFNFLISNNKAKNETSLTLVLVLGGVRVEIMTDPILVAITIV